jgi:hypothetical protein
VGYFHGEERAVTANCGEATTRAGKRRLVCSGVLDTESLAMVGAC